MADAEGQAPEGQGSMPDAPLTALDVERFDELTTFITHTVLNADEPALLWGMLITDLLATAAQHRPFGEPAERPDAFASIGVPDASNLDAFTVGASSYVATQRTKGGGMYALLNNAGTLAKALAKVLDMGAPTLPSN
jgi:hypothetical protein